MAVGRQRGVLDNGMNKCGRIFQAQIVDFRRHVGKLDIRGENLSGEVVDNKTPCTKELRF